MFGNNNPGPSATITACVWRRSSIRRASSVGASVTPVGRLVELRREVDSSLETWLLGRFGGLSNLPSDPPVMLHHIPRYLAALRDVGRIERVALLVVDGLAWDQWLLVRAALAVAQHGWAFSEFGVFAWIRR